VANLKKHVKGLTHTLQYEIGAVVQVRVRSLSQILAFSEAMVFSHSWESCDGCQVMRPSCGKKKALKI
jgi:hypothetical protein